MIKATQLDNFLYLQNCNSGCGNVCMKGHESSCITVVVFPTPSIHP